MVRSTVSCALAGGLVGIMLLLVGCGGAGGPAPTAEHTSPESSAGRPSAVAKPASLTRVSLLLAWLPNTANQLPFYLAKKRGYYKAAGLDVTITSGKGSARTVQQVGAGQFDIGQADLNVMAIGRSKGVPVKAVMVELGKTTFGVFGSRAKKISTWKDLYGKTLGMTAGNVGSFLLPATFAKLGLDYSKVKIINTSAPEQNASYMTGKVDAISTDLAGSIPYIDPARPSYHLWFGKVLPVVYMGLFSRTSYIEAHPAVVRGVVAGTLKALSGLLNSPSAVSEAARFMSDSNPGKSRPPQQLIASWKLNAKYVRSGLAKGRPLGWMPRPAWASTLDILRKYAGMKGGPSLSSYFTNKFIS